MSLLKTKRTDDSDINTAIKNTTIEEEEEVFVPASTWEGLEWIGTPEWQEKQNVVEGHNFRKYLLL
jgi:hypothetical protein